MRCQAFGVLVLLTVAAVARPQGEAKKDLQAMDGTWAVTIAEIDGKKATDELKKKGEVKLVLKDGKYTVYVGDKQLSTGMFKLDAPAPDSDSRGPDLDESLPQVDLPLIMPDEMPTGRAPAPPLPRRFPPVPSSHFIPALRSLALREIVAPV